MTHYVTDLHDEASLVALFDDETWRTAFRYEGLPMYDVSSDRNADGMSDFDRWRNGAPTPDMKRKAAVLDSIRSLEENGQHTRRVRYIGPTPSEYERYACEWGYAYNQQAGEEIQVWDGAQRPLPHELARLPDFWMLDDRLVAAMHYDPTGRFLGWADVSDHAGPTYRAARTALLARAEPFHTWWARRTDLYRRIRA